MYLDHPGLMKLWDRMKAVFAPKSHKHQASEIAGLSTVATSGNYSDLSGKPSAATESADGLMSAADKKKLGGIANVKDWVVSRSQNLISNGFATLGDNTNFTGFEFDGADAFQSGGSFSYRVTSPSSKFTEELMPYDPSNSYRLSYYIKSDCASAKYYDILDCYDIDGHKITDEHVTFVAGSTTTLAADLKPGDTSVSVESAAGFNASDTDGRQRFNRGLMFWNYSNSYGYTYPPETYTMNRYNNLWTSNATAIDKAGNRILLDKAWSGHTVPKGTSVSQTENSSTFVYGNESFSVPAGEWTRKECTFENKARPGTAYVKIGWLILNVMGGASSVTTKLTGVSFGAVPAYANSAAEADTATEIKSQAGVNASLEKLPTWTATPTDSTQLVRRDTANEAAYGRVTFLTVWNYIKGKADALYAPKSSPAFTGNPTAPTPSFGDSSKSLATTEFVANAIKGASAPTDYIVAQGKCDFWTWRMWASGVAECWGSTGETYENVTSEWGYLYEGAAHSNGFPGNTSESSALAFSVNLGGVTYTRLFKEAPEFCSCSFNPTVSAGISGIEIGGGLTDITTPTVYLLRPTPSRVDGQYSYFAKGRWK